MLNQDPPTELLTDVDDEANNAVEDENIPLKPIMLDKVKEGLKDLANNKAAGLDLIPAELLKCSGEAMCCELTRLANIVWHSQKVPDEWKRSAIVKLPKKGDLRDCNNWRGITLLVITRKLVCWILIKRLQSVVDEKLREEQAGFRHHQSCNEQVFMLRNIIERSLEYNSPLIVNYVDFKKASIAYTDQRYGRLFEHMAYLKNTLIYLKNYMTIRIVV